MPENRHLSITTDGDLLAEATVSTPDEAGSVKVAVSMASGQLPAGARQLTADAIHEKVVNDHAERVTATVPSGDAELVESIRTHLEDPALTAAGSTSIVQGSVKVA